MDSKVSSSGNVIVKNNVTLRYDTILAKEWKLALKPMSAQSVMTMQFKFRGIEIGKKLRKMFYRNKCKFCNMLITVGNNVIIGASVLFIKIVKQNPHYVGIPAKKYSESGENYSNW